MIDVHVTISVTARLAKLLECTRYAWIPVFPRRISGVLLMSKLGHASRTMPNHERKSGIPLVKDLADGLSESLRATNGDTVQAPELLLRIDGSLPFPSEQLESLIRPGSHIDMDVLESGESGACPHPPGHSCANPADSSLILICTHGPQTGRSIPLSRGIYTLGRDNANIRFDDPEMSRNQASVEVHPERVSLVVPPRARPVLINGRNVQQGILHLGDNLQMGSTILKVCSAQQLFTESGEPLAMPVRVPGPSTAADSGRKIFSAASLASVLVPVVMGICMALVFKSWMFLLFCAFGAVGTFLTGLRPKSKRSRARDLERELSEYGAQLEASLLHVGPLYMATELGNDLAFTKAPDRPFFTAEWSANICLGRGELELPTPEEGKPSPAPVADRANAHRKGKAPSLDAPHPQGAIALTVKAGGRYAILASRQERFVHNIAVQLGILHLLGHAPEICVVVDQHTAALNLPHLPGISAFTSQQIAHSSAQPSRQRIILVHAGAVEALNPSNSDTLIILCEHNTDLPAKPSVFWGSVHTQLDAIITLSATSLRAELLTFHWLSNAGGTPEPHKSRWYKRSQEFTPDLLDPHAFAQVGRFTLAARRAQGILLAQNGSDAQEVSELVDMSTDALKIRWEHSEVHRAPFLIGILDETSARAPGKASRAELDLDTDGPHFLIAGTTGSGKSELLRSLVLSMAALNSPRHLNFLFVDFKGGAAFSPFTELPHSAGFVTDLNMETIERTLICLRAETRRRKKLFASYGANDIREYWDTNPTSEPTVDSEPDARQPTMARLVVVVDEFRMLAEESPDAVRELMRIATVGRSLGIHLILCTQRPQGAITADIRANISTVFCLRVQNSSESVDILGSAIAADISPAAPGRAYARLGSGTPFGFQSLPSVSMRPQNNTEILMPLRSWWNGHAERGSSQSSTTRDLTEVIAAFSKVSLNQFKAWNPVNAELPKQLAVREPGSLVDENFTVELGIQDIPHEQRQARLSWNPHLDSHLALVGGSRSGAIQALEFITCALVSPARSSSAPHHSAMPKVNIIDGDGSLRDFSECEGILSYHHHEDLRSLAQFVQYFPTFLALMAHQRSPHKVVLVISGWTQLCTLLRASRFIWVEEAICALVRAHGSVLTVVVSGGRDLLTSKLAAEASQQLIFPSGANSDLAMALPKTPAIDSIMGRALLIGKGAVTSFEHGFNANVCQIYLHDTPSCSHHEGSQNQHSAHHRPDRIEPLPEYLEKSQISAPAQHWRNTAKKNSALAIGERAYPRQAIPYPIVSGNLHLILGSPESGKTTLLNELLRHTKNTIPPGFSTKRIFWLDQHESAQHRSDTLQSALSLLKADGVSAALRPVLPPGGTRTAHRREREATPSTQEKNPVLKTSVLLFIDELEQLNSEQHQQLAEAMRTNALTIVATASLRPGLFARVPLATSVRNGNAVVVIGAERSSDIEAFGYRYDAPYPLGPGRALILGGVNPLEVQLYAPDASLSTAHVIRSLAG